VTGNQDSDGEREAGVLRRHLEGEDRVETRPEDVELSIRPLRHAIGENREVEIHARIVRSVR
jgi:hypothetical protein